MTERERTIIRVAGLAVHALGFVVLVVGILAGSFAVGIVGGLAFIVGGCWGWGMVAAASAEAERVRAHERSHAEFLSRSGLDTGFSARFDDAPPDLPPPGAAGASIPAPTWPPDED